MAPQEACFAIQGYFVFYKKIDPVFGYDSDIFGGDEEAGVLRLGTPAGEVARCDMYDRIINTFDECIAILKSTRGHGIQDEKGGDDRGSVAGNKNGSAWRTHNEHIGQSGEWVGLVWDHSKG